MKRALAGFRERLTPPLAVGLALLVMAACVGLSFAVQLAAWLRGTPGLLQRDFTAFYVLASAMRQGLDTNLPLTKLAADVGHPGLTLFPHPSPHPPTAGFLLLPLSWLDINTAALVWMGFCIAALFLTVVMLLKLLDGALPMWLAPVFTVALLAWEPIIQDLSWGNINIPIVAFLSATVVCLRSRRPKLAGVMLALALLLKPICWPILLLLLLRRRWSTLVNCGATGAAVAVATAVVVGPLALVRYLTVSLPVATQFYEKDFYNLSLVRLGARLFEGAQFRDVDPQLFFASLLQAPRVASLLTPILLVGVVLGGLILTRKMSLESAFACCVCVSLAASPTVWLHYFTLLLLPAAVLLSSLHRRSWPQPLTRVALLLLLLLASPIDLWMNLALRIQPTSVGPLTYWPVLPSVLSLLLPVSFMLALIPAIRAADDSALPAVEAESNAVTTARGARLLSALIPV